jgi:hypothetical protein
MQQQLTDGVTTQTQQNALGLSVSLVSTVCFAVSVLRARLQGQTWWNQRCSSTQTACTSATSVKRWCLNIVLEDFLHAVTSMV